MMQTRKAHKTLYRLLLGLILGLAGSLLVTSGWLTRLDLALYDSLIEYQFRDAREEITIITIDESSLGELGRWPWSRKIHAQLLDELTRLEVKAVAFDILFAEEEDLASDQSFASAMERNGHTVLAVAPEQGTKGELTSESLPLPILAVAAAAIGHVDVELDVDGLCRSVYLRAGLGTSNWPSLGLALKQTAYPNSIQQHETELNPHSNDPKKNLNWVRDQKILIPFVGPSGHIRRISYSDVLYQRADPALLKDHIVLIGSTASGLGDALATPASRDHDRMPGVELNANILNTLLENKAILQIPLLTRQLITFTVILISVLVLTLLPIRYGLITVLLLASTTLAATLVTLLALNLWFPPISLLAIQAIAYPVWNWFSRDRDNRVLQRLHSRVEHQARHHIVTELPNQLGLREYIEAKIKHRPHPDRMLALLVINLGPQEISNDSLGFSGSSQLLKVIASRLAQNTRQDDLVAHLSGNDFALVVDNIENIETIGKICTLLNQIFKQPVAMESREFNLSLSIGISLFPKDATCADNLLMHAYTAMHKAKQDKSTTPCFFSEEIELEDNSKKKFELLLRRALGNSELEVYYQPQVEAGSYNIVGVEALLRWKSPELGLVGPVKFIPVAEQTGIILEIGNWVLRQACKQAKSWKDEGFGDIRMAVNLSAQQFAQPGIVNIISRIVAESGLPPELLELEITEGSLIQNMEAARQALQSFSKMGIKVAIDDFGTGYSSLSYLKYFPLDKLKIDRSFISEIGQSENSNEIILAIIGMAHKLNLDVIAEGVETNHQAKFLHTHHCDEFQGYLYGKAVPFDLVTEKLREARIIARVDRTS